MEEGLWTRWNTEGERKGKDYTRGWREGKRARGRAREREKTDKTAQKRHGT